LAKLLPEIVNQNRVDLDRDDSFGSREEALGERALPGTDLENERDSRRAGGPGDSLQDGWAFEEMLPQPPAQSS
jgi:hypothetical protein